MKVYSGDRVREIILSILCVCLSVCLLITVSACENAVTPTSPETRASATATERAAGSTYAPSAHRGTPEATASGTPQQEAANVVAGSAPGPVTAGSGALPASFPRYFSFGIMSEDSTLAELDGMRANNGTQFAFRYQYLVGGTNTGHGWESWGGTDGYFATQYMQENAQHSYIPTFVYYEMCQTDGPHPSSYCGGHDAEQDLGNIQSLQTMKSYYANWVLLMQRIADFGKPVLVIVEPDLWGFLQHNSDDAAQVPASVGSSGYEQLAGYPNTVQGFAWALLHLRDMYAKNAVLALHASLWSAGAGVGTDTRMNLDVGLLNQKETRFLESAGLTGNPVGVSSWDLLSNDVADFDSGQPGGRGWWDRYNKTFPNFQRYLDFIGALSKATQRRVVMWQGPLGNQYFRTMNNTAGHYQDNRAEYILSNVASFAQAGIVAVLFGAGNSGTKNGDKANDKVTNPEPISSYECDKCNTHMSVYPDDDGGFLRIFIGQYMQHPVAIS